MAAGKVTTLGVLGGNPVYNSPGDQDFSAALNKVETSVHLSLFRDETSSACSWHVPMAHFLESWGDARSRNATVSIVQPLIAPLYGGKSAIELLALILRSGPQDGLGIVKATLGRRLGDERLWRKAVHDGVVMASAMGPVMPALKEMPLIAMPKHTESTVGNGELEITFNADAALHDGRYSNIGWLQELPDTMTKLTWDNVALIHPTTAKQLGIRDATMPTVSVGGKSIQIPVMVSPGQAEDSIRLTVGSEV